MIPKTTLWKNKNKKKTVLKIKPKKTPNKHKYVLEKEIYSTPVLS